VAEEADVTGGALEAGVFLDGFCVGDLIKVGVDDDIAVDDDRDSAKGRKFDFPATELIVPGANGDSRDPARQPLFGGWEARLATCRAADYG